MAKGQKKSTKEVRKPKKDKGTGSAPTPVFASGSLTNEGTGKKKD